MSIEKGRKAELIKEFAIKEGDAGSVEVQCAIVTDRIKNLTEHFKEHGKDYSSRRGLLILVSRRKSLLAYLKSRDEARYKALIARLGLKK